MKWECDCESENEDLPEETAVPICGNCGKEWFWREIESQQRMLHDSL